MEKWKNIDGYDGIFQISDQGRLRRVTEIISVPGRWGNPVPRTIPGWTKGPVFHAERGITNRGGGYYQYTTYFRGKCCNFYIHREVAKAFVPNPDNKPSVNHIDGNKHNNCATNLEWATSSEQMQHAVKTGLIDYSKSRNAKIANARKSLRWFTNGSEEICVPPEKCPKGWRPGRKPRRKVKN